MKNHRKALIHEKTGKRRSRSQSHSRKRRFKHIPEVHLVATSDYISDTELFQVDIKFNTKFDIVTKELTILKPILSASSYRQANEQVRTFLSKLHQELTAGMKPGDMIFCALFHPELHPPIGIKFTRLENFTQQMLENEIMRVCQ